MVDGDHGGDAVQTTKNFLAKCVEYVGGDIAVVAVDGVGEDADVGGVGGDNCVAVGDVVGDLHYPPHHR